MSNLFGKAPSAPAAPPPPPPPPTVSDADVQAEQLANQMRQRRGRAATILSDQTGSGSLTPNVGSKTLLGS